MTTQYKLIFAALLFLIPIGTILFQWVFYYIGRFFWEHFMLKKLKRTAKLRIRFIEFRARNGADLIYVLTGIIATYLLFAVISLFI